MSGPEAGRHFVAVEERRAGRGLRLVTFSFSITFPKDEVQDALDVAAGLAEPTLLANELGVDVDTESAPSLAVEMVFVAPIMNTSVIESLDESALECKWSLHAWPSQRSCLARVPREECHRH